MLLSSPAIATVELTLFVAMVAALVWVTVRTPPLGLGLIGSFMGALAALLILAYRTRPNGLAVGLAIGTGLGLVLGVLLGAFADGRDPTPGREGSRSVWFVLSAILGGVLILWTIEVFVTSPRDPLWVTMLVGLTLVYASGLALRPRWPALALVLLLGLDGFAAGIFLGAVVIVRQWGVEVGAMIGATVGIVEGVLVGWRSARRASDASP